MNNFERIKKGITMSRLARLLSSRCDNCPLCGSNCFDKSNIDKSCYTMVYEFLTKECEDYE